ncbi:crotonase/enoyl-CoA hydratase family protein [Kistimonas scapharcae]|uniref:Crotonase/enoyl-CoA hydratase family protein n=1 Tax=Kistimonas scapharcae TaxID=1036133 RepID=A0ABP8VBB0_9GAMM
MPEQPILLFEQQDHIATITLNRPETRHAISESDMVEALVSACHRLNEDDSIRVAILTATGSTFCSGGNLKDMRDKQGMFAGDEKALMENYRQGIQRIPLALSQVEVPLIAAVNGAAVGAGCDLACMCDIRIASDTALFAESFINMGLIPGDGGAWFLPRVIGISRATEMALTGRSIDAETACRWGLVSEVVRGDELMSCANAIAQEIAANPPLALKATKRLLQQGQTMPLPELLAASASLQATLHGTRDHSEAVNAFLEKRKPQFTGQ